MRAIEQECAALQSRADEADCHSRSGRAARAGRWAQPFANAQSRSRRPPPEQQETSQQLEQVRQELSAERARHASIEQILRERAYTADAVQKLFNANGDATASRGFRAVGLLADYAEVQEEYEAAIEQFLREELEYVVVESFDQARAGVALLREDVGGRATFFVDSARTLDVDKMENGASMPGNFIARLDRLVEFREPLGPATKYFLKKLRTAYLVESVAVAEQMAQDNPHSYFLTPDGTCYHGRTVSGGRKSDAGPLALKRELRRRESETARLEQLVVEQQTNLSRLEEETAAAEIAGFRGRRAADGSRKISRRRRAPARGSPPRIPPRRSAARWRARLKSRVSTPKRKPPAPAPSQARSEHAEAVRSRAAAEAEAAEAAEKLADLRRDFQQLQERVVARREELATMTERLASAETVEQSLSAEIAQANHRADSLRQQHDALAAEKSELESSCEQLALQAEDLRREKTRLEENKAALETE